MSLHVDYTVLFNDHTDTIRQHLIQGPERDIFSEYIALHMPDYQLGADVTLNRPEQLVQLGQIAAEVYPIVVDVSSSSLAGDDVQYDFEGRNDPHARDYLALVNPLERDALFQHDDPRFEEFYHQRYAQLFNQGKALFGAQLKNIDTIQFQLN